MSNRIEIEFGSVSTRNASESVSKRKLFGAKKIKKNKNAKKKEKEKRKQRKQTKAKKSTGK